MKLSDNHLTKPTQPLEQLNVNFKGPLSKKMKSKYILTIINKFSRFPFAFPFKDISGRTAINYLSISMFAIFVMSTYMGTGRGPRFLRSGLKRFLHQKGIPTIRTTSNNTTANEQVERCIRIARKPVNFALKT